MQQHPSGGLSVDNATSKLERIRAARRAFAQNLDTSTVGAASTSQPPAAAAAASSSLPERAMPPTPALATEMAGWPCSGCTYINVESASTCALCSAPRDGWLDDSGDAPDGRSWSCTVCTFANSSEHAACEMCGHRRGDGEGLSPGGGGWTCTTCTLENTESDVSCAACSATRPGGSPHDRPFVGSVSELTEGLSPSEAKLVEAALKLKLKDLAD